MHSVQYAELRRHNLHQQLIQKQVVEDTVGNEPIDPRTFEEEKSRYLKAKGVEGDENLKKYLRRNGLEQKDLEWQIALPLRIRSFCVDQYKPKAEAHFLARKNQLDKVIYSLIRVSGRLLAKELYLRIKAGESSFADLAASFSEGNEKNTNGIIGPVPLCQAHPVLSEKLRTSSAGDLISPFKIAEWWLIVKLEQYTPAVYDESMEQKMCEELFSQMINELTTAKILNTGEQSGGIH